MRAHPKDPNPDGEFGKVPTGGRGIAKKLLLVFAAGAFAPVVLLVGGGAFIRIFDWSGPSVGVVALASTISDEGSSIEFEAFDRTGIYDATLVARQGNLVQELWREEAPERELRMQRTVPIRLGASFQDGSVDLSLSVRDRSVWGRTTGKLSRVIVDRSPPEISKVVSYIPTRPGDVGGVAFTVGDHNLVSVSLVVGDRVSALEPLSEVKDPAAPRSYVALFPLPVEAIDSPKPGQQRNVRVVAHDRAGRESSMMLINPIPGRSETPVIWKLSDATVERAVNITFARHESDLVGRGIFVPEHLNALDEGSRTIERARILLDKLRVEDIERLRLWFTPSGRTPRQFRGPWVRPGGTASGQFGTLVEVQDKLGAKIGSMVMPGRLYEFPANSKVVGAMAPGKVLFAGDLGTFGLTVILDHGYGLFSGYSGLSEILMKTDDDVRRRDAVGRPGRSGLTNESNSALIFAGAAGEFADPEAWFRGDGVIGFLDSSIRGFGAGRDE
jgi:murein DD-endopeptidase MepM/ murein hydrolase activator NlpD